MALPWSFDIMRKILMLLRNHLVSPTASASGGHPTAAFASGADLPDRPANLRVASASGARKAADPGEGDPSLAGTYYLKENPF